MGPRLRLRDPAFPTFSVIPILLHTRLGVNPTSTLDWIPVLGPLGCQPVIFPVSSTHEHPMNLKTPQQPPCAVPTTLSCGKLGYGGHSVLRPHCGYLAGSPTERNPRKRQGHLTCPKGSKQKLTGKNAMVHLIILRQKDYLIDPFPQRSSASLENR